MGNWVLLKGSVMAFLNMLQFVLQLFGPGPLGAACRFSHVQWQMSPERAQVEAALRYVAFESGSTHRRQPAVVWYVHSDEWHLYSDFKNSVWGPFLAHCGILSAWFTRLMEEESVLRFAVDTHMAVFVVSVDETDQAMVLSTIPGVVGMSKAKAATWPLTLRNAGYDVIMTGGVVADHKRPLSGLWVSFGE
ncbi:MAG: hypothetical protein A3J38_07475 [Gammaproteobacteria bacterium RIFCSPHIGHO2_12_FULL_45_9]|nr:MAG: hypothetical protein A3J38_07475 [Gammaproteobacteria bacterium RIFCSPHIGHO2_12_FULL_45_9]